MLADQNDFAAAESDYRKALSLQEVIVESHDDFTNRRCLAVTLFNLGGLLHQTSRFDAAESTTERALELLQSLTEENPTDHEAAQPASRSTQ